jgi:cbb3-type cytochrome oxidase subunit 3
VRALGILSIVEEIIKQSDEFLKNLTEEKNLKTYFVNSNLAILALSAIYGATMGLYAGELQILYSAIKVPMLLLISLYLTVPSYYVLYLLLGGKRTLGQTVMLLLSGFTIMSTVLIALVPVNLFFIITTTKSFTTYAFTVLLNIAIFTLGGFFALIYFIKGARALYQKPSENWKPAFLLGSIILMFVGTQLAWVLRPYFNYDPSFMRPLESNFYTAVLELLVRFTGGFGAFLIVFALFFLGLLFYSALAPARKELAATPAQS